jgi:hypothetical protein
MDIEKCQKDAEKMNREAINAYLKETEDERASANAYLKETEDERASAKSQSSLQKMPV